MQTRITASRIFQPFQQPANCFTVSPRHGVPTALVDPSLSRRASASFNRKIPNAIPLSRDRKPWIVGGNRFRNSGMCYRTVAASGGWPRRVPHPERVGYANLPALDLQEARPFRAILFWVPLSDFRPATCKRLN